MEAEFIAWLRSRLPVHPQLLLGPGDDAAILRLTGDPRCVLSVDMLTEGVDFRLSEVTPDRVGRKALAVNLSDLAAMAARPLAAVVALAVPREQGLEIARQFYEGLLPLAEKYQVAIAGGDTNSWDGPLVASITVIGEVTARGPLLRGGAQAGDRIVVTGQFGGSILGRHFSFEPRVAEALWLHEHAELHAGIDCSDGLSLDLHRLCVESRCGAILDLDRLPISAAAEQLAAQTEGGNPRDFALGDGEDFELILAMPAASAAELIARQPLACTLTDIGQFTAESGLWYRDPAGNVLPLTPRGYQH